MTEAIEPEAKGPNGREGAKEESLCSPLYIFTRTPLHVGAGASVGAIDLPIQRERHTGFPIIPGSTLKGVFADCCYEQKGDGSPTTTRSSDGKWLFGSDDAENAAAGALQFSEAKLLAFPIRSAKGCFAWITCPLILKRYARDLGKESLVASLPDVKDEEARFDTGTLGIGKKVILEEYAFTHVGDPSSEIGEALAALLPEDPIWTNIWTKEKKRLVILSDASMSFFARSSCEVAQHVKISDETGAAEEGALFNQENVPSETMFYSLVRASQERRGGEASERRPPRAARSAFRRLLEQEKGVFQFGADAGTGLGFCTVRLGEEAERQS